MKLKKHSCKRAVAPVIGNLLLIAIAAVGATIVFTFSESFISSAQSGGFIPVESLTIVGYDARAVPTLQAHDGNLMSADSGGNSNGFKEADERIAVYIRSDSTNPIVIYELNFAGTPYGYVQATSGILGLYTSADVPMGNFTILTNTNPDSLLQIESPIIQPGQTVTLILDLENDLKVGRSSQINFKTTNANHFVGTINIGQQSG